METLTIVGFGLAGGLTRALVGLFKHKALTKKKFKKGRFLFTIIGSALIGGFCALLTIADYRIPLLAGYAGTDLIEGVYRMSG